eukprot:TRINITY_DN37415_c0_g1_i1.p1 TRINITY_DN37415_c0_g1~~TRINITY_DN37415_c0_g1_i1.p1  ORF type:complete len:329 (+),score=65.27 TRINITY_DN37415_c0_g1_i1:68-988(+)
MPNSAAIRIVEQLSSGERISQEVPMDETTIKDLLSEARAELSRGGSYVEMTAPATVVGDIHGQFNDLVQIFKAMKPPGQGGRYMFLGDYVDRGRYSLETICLLLAYKVLYPADINLLRGNHECSSINRIYGFYDDCKRRYNVKLFRLFDSVFNYLPLAGCVGERIFCVHGGLAHGLKTIDDVKSIKLPTAVPDIGVMCDMLWADICSEGDEATEQEYVDPCGRAVQSADYTPLAVKNFLARNGFDLIVRAHQMVQEGYEFIASKQLVTIFSAPQYCGEFDNFGAVMHVDSELVCSMHVLKPSSLGR